jgi:four helix bundle protein
VSGASYQQSEIRKKEEAVQRVSSFEDLNVFQRAYQLSLDVHRRSLDFPKIEQAALADQMRRASKSICGNIAEGFGRQRRSKAEFKRFLLMAIGSADEMQVWIKYCFDLGYLEPSVGGQWRAEYKEIAKMLQGLYSSWDNPDD